MIEIKTFEELKEAVRNLVQKDNIDEDNEYHEYFYVFDLNLYYSEIQECYFLTCAGLGVAISKDPNKILKVIQAIKECEEND